MHPKVKAEATLPRQRVGREFTKKPEKISPTGSCRNAGEVGLASRHRRLSASRRNAREPEERTSLRKEKHRLHAEPIF